MGTNLTLRLPCIPETITSAVIQKGTLVQIKQLVVNFILLFFIVGEGQFGKVYACVNLDTGEVMAVKQVRELQRLCKKC